MYIQYPDAQNKSPFYEEFTSLSQDRTFLLLKTLISVTLFPETLLAAHILFLFFCPRTSEKLGVFYSQVFFQKLFSLLFFCIDSEETLNTLNPLCSNKQCTGVQNFSLWRERQRCLFSSQKLQSQRIEYILERNLKNLSV